MSSIMLSNSDDFDVYIDQIRFAPDCSVLMKVSCKLIYAGETLPEFYALSDATSESRSLKLHRNKYHGNADGAVLSGETSLIYRLSGISRANNELCLLGMGAMSLFQSSQSGSFILRTGGHQLRVYQGEPDRKGAPNESSFHLDKAVPCVTITLRIEPHSEEFIEAPSYSSGYYCRGNFFMTEKEKKIMQYYRKHIGPIRDRVKQECLEVQRRDFVHVSPEKLDDDSLLDESDILESSSDQEVQTWMAARLDRNHALNQGKALGSFKAERTVGYDEELGVGIKMTKMFNVDSKQRYVNIAGAIITADNQFPDLLVVNNRHNFESVSNFQQWLCSDEDALINFRLGKNAKLFVIIYAMDWNYTPDPELNEVGKVTDKDSSQGVSLGPQNAIGWGVVDLLTLDECLNAGSHFVPVFSGDAPLKNKSLRDLSAAEWIEANLALEKIVVSKPAGVIKVDICNGFDVKYDSLPVDKTLIQITGKQASQALEKSISSASKATGGTLGGKVIATLPKKEAKLGRKSTYYNKAVDVYERSMNAAFFDQVKVTLNCEQIHIM